MKRKYIDKSLRRLRRRRDDPEKTRAYTPGDLQRLAQENANGAGIMRPDTVNLSLPGGLDDMGEDRQTAQPVRVVLVIVTLALIWIAILVYFISQMPDPKEAGESPSAGQNLMDDGRSKSESSK
jgi:hypothetical protein